MARSASEPARIGVFGGTFDPPHFGHVALLEAATRGLELDRVLVVPTAIPPHRPTPVASAQLRRDFAELAFGHLPGVELSDLESRDGSPTYTVDTLATLASATPAATITLLLGADGLVHFGSWHRWREIGVLARIAVVGRPQLVSPDDLAEAITTLRHEGLTVIEVPMEPVDISASQIRRFLASEDWSSLAQLVPEAVAHALRTAAPGARTLPGASSGW